MHRYKKASTVVEVGTLKVLYHSPVSSTKAQSHLPIIVSTNATCDFTFAARSLQAAQNKIKSEGV